MRLFAILAVAASLSDCHVLTPWCNRATLFPRPPLVLQTKFRKFGEDSWSDLEACVHWSRSDQADTCSYWQFVQYRYERYQTYHSQIGINFRLILLQEDRRWGRRRGGRGRGRVQDGGVDICQERRQRRMREGDKS